MIHPNALVELSQAHPEARFVELATLALGEPWEEVSDTEQNHFFWTHLAAFQCLHHPELLGHA